MREAGTAVAEVVTGEAVVLEVPCARFPSRLLALVIDMAIQVVLLVVLFLIVGVATAGGGLDQASAAAIGLTVVVLVIVGYPVLWETLTRGASPGKYALGLRVVSDDGAPERFRQALVRGLAAVVEIWILFGVPALISSLLSDRGKRLGDIFAGTFVIQQRLPARQNAAPLPPVSPELMLWGAGLEMSGLTEQTAETARRYLARLPELTPAARAELGQRIAGAVSAQVSPPPPPGTPVTDYLGAVLVERRNRENARLAADSPRLAGPPPWGPARPGSPPPWSPPGPVPPAAPVPSATLITQATPAAPVAQSSPAAHSSPAVPAPPGGQDAWRPGPRAAEYEEETPHQQPPAGGTGGFVPPA
jgi:uncharacterized RDD family membrane protein YckC